MTEAALSAIVAVVLVSLMSLAGVLLLLLGEGLMRRCILYLVGFSSGALLGDAFLHIIPEMAEEGTIAGTGGPLILVGIVISYLIECVISWTHCHELPCEEHYHPVGTLSLIGDTIHNFLDGILIAGSFIVSLPIGLATTVAVALHEIPQELGDFAILLFSGFSRTRALLFNLLTATTAIAGAVIVLVSSSSVPAISSVILPVTAGHFVYIAAADLIPALHREVRMLHITLQFFCLLSGMGVMYVLTLL